MALLGQAVVPPVRVDLLGGYTQVKEMEQLAALIACSLSDPIHQVLIGYSSLWKPA